MIYDIGIIGGGPGGYVAAIKAAQLGAKCVLFEEDNVGGVCLNRGCIPTKTLLKSSQVYSMAKNAASFGVFTEGCSFDYSKVADRKQKVVKQLTGGVGSLLKKNGVTVVKHHADLMNENTIKAGGEEYTVKNVILATGSVPARPPIKGIEYALNSDDVLELTELPKSIAIVGGGVIGLEFAVLFAEFGVKVTMIEMLPHVIEMADDDLIAEAEKILKSKGVEVFTGACVTQIEKNGIRFESSDKTEKEISAECMFVATGRVPNVDTVMLDRLGIKRDRGRVSTDEQMRTNKKGIYAIGDLNGKYMLAHTASAEGIVAVENIMGKSRTMKYDAIPQCIYTTPEIAWVGLTEKRAKELGIQYKTGIFPIIANGKALTEGEQGGMIKLIFAENGEILGAHLVCIHATDMIAEIALLIEMEGTVEDVIHTIHPHPTMSEAVMEASEAACGHSIHF